MENVKKINTGKRLLRLITMALVLALTMTFFNVAVVKGDPGWYDSNWSYRKKITVDNTKVIANLTDFPVLINLVTDSDLAGNAQNDSDDILFTSADGTTKLNHEIEKFDDGTGELVAWVKNSTLSSSTDTFIYMYYGNASAGNQENITAVWDSNYLAVWHLREDPSGAAPQMLDSTSNNYDGTSEGSWVTANQVAGLIDGSLDFNSGIDKIKAGTFDVVAGGSGDNGMTLEAWVYSDEHRDGRFISKAAGTDTSQHWWMLNAVPSGADSYLRFRLKLDGTTTALQATLPDTFPIGQWVHTVATYDGSNMRIYQDASQVASTAASGTISMDNSVAVAIGNQPTDAGDRRFDGRITEVRISNIARSSDWIQTEYNNHKYPDKAIHGDDGFFSLGDEETPPSPTPSPVGGEIFHINKFAVLAPWFALVALIPCLVAGVRRFRQYQVHVEDREGGGS